MLLQYERVVPELPVRFPRSRSIRCALGRVTGGRTRNRPAISVSKPIRWTRGGINGNRIQEGHIRTSPSSFFPQFPNRASWLLDRLRERSWNKHDLARHRGPDRKTTQKVLDGLAVREDVLEKIAKALSSKKGANVEVTDIPQD